MATSITFEIVAGGNDYHGSMKINLGKIRKFCFKFAGIPDN